MSQPALPSNSRSALWERLGFPSLLLLALFGCSKPPAPAKPVDVEPHVRVVKPERRTISRTVGQPGFIYAYEQTAIFPKVAGYIEKWYVDIGDPIKKDQEIATLFVPELNAELLQKQAQVSLDEAQVQVAQRMAEVAGNNVKVAAAQINEAQANVKKYQAAVERWESEVKRLTSLSDQRIVDKQVLDESRKQLKADTAAREAAQSTVVAAEATELARKSDLEKAKADIVAARAKAQASREDVKRIAAMVSYTHITAPYDGTVVIRNANTGDYLQPGSGDQSGTNPPPGQSSGRRPLYIVARTDRVRVYVDVPEMDAASVHNGTRASVHIQALRDAVIPAAVTRTSWSLQPESRTLRAEIDLPNPDKRLLPGMYAIGEVLIERPNVWAIPLSAVVELGNQNCCYLLENGRAVRTPVQVGINDGKWIETPARREKDTWIPLTGRESVILGDLSQLSDGEPVKIEEKQ